MPSVLRVVVVDPDSQSRSALRRMLGGTPSVAVLGEYADLAEALRSSAGRNPDIFMVEVSDAPGARNVGVGRIEQIASAYPDAAILAMGPSGSAEFIIQAMRAGALEFLPRPVERADLTVALEKVGRMRRGVAASEPRAGRVTSVFSTKGGLGCTTLAINLTVCLAERHPGRTLLIELDTRQSDIATFLDLRPAYSVLDAFENLERLDDSFLQGLLTRHRSGLAVLPGPSQMERTQLNGDQVRAGLDMIRSHFDHVVLDLRHDMDPGTIAGLEASDTILFITSLNVSALRSGAAGLAAFRHLGLDLQKVRVVIMREDTGKEVTQKDARDALGVPIAWKTPSDYEAVVTSINKGQPVVTASPKSKIARNLRQLAESLPTGPGESRVHVAPKRSTSLLRYVWHPKSLPGGG